MDATATNTVILKQRRIFSTQADEQVKRIRNWLVVGARECPSPYGYPLLIYYSLLQYESALSLRIWPNKW